MVVIAEREFDLESLLLTVAAVTVLWVGAVVNVTDGSHLILAFLMDLLPTHASFAL